MAVTQKGFFFQGLSGDTKPTTGITANDRFLETNTGKEFIWSGAAWVPALSWTDEKLLKGAGAGVAPDEIDVPGGADFPMKLKPALTRWVIPGWYAHGSQGVSVAGARIFYIPIYVSQDTTYIRIGLEVTTGVAGTVDIRIFAWTNGLPGALVLNCGAVDTAVAGLKEIVIDWAATRGYYFLAYRPTVALDVTGLNVANPIVGPVAGGNPVNGASPTLILPTVDAAYADPAPAPTNWDSAGRLCLRMREN